MYPGVAGGPPARRHPARTRKTPEEPIMSTAGLTAHAETRAARDLVINRAACAAIGVVAFAGAVLDPARGPVAEVLCVGLGASGLPIFTGGASGIARLAGPTGGYL